MGAGGEPRVHAGAPRTCADPARVARGAVCRGPRRLCASADGGGVVSGSEAWSTQGWGGWWQEWEEPGEPEGIQGARTRLGGPGGTRSLGDEALGAARARLVPTARLPRSDAVSHQRAPRGVRGGVFERFSALAAPSPVPPAPR